MKNDPISQIHSTPSLLGRARGGSLGGGSRVWRETVTIPTYEVGKPEKNPIFLEKRVYQGSSGVVYPYPVIESIANKPTDHEWHAVFLENEYLKIMVLPELGGRIQMAYDKVKLRHFVYYNHVIKPALVGLTGPWISGGIEFNWPQHHRPSTYLPVDCTIEEAEDGSVTVWCNEMERMFHQKGLVGFTLRPGCAYLEIRGRLSNPTPLPQTFLWWANPAVEVNDAYQSVFPPDVNAVFDHGKRAVSTFPIATGTYYKMDYSSGVDISNYRNIPVPTSYMAVNSKYDFEGGYENDTHCGMLHVASHHISPGKKQWTWGNGDFGRAWDRNLTDDASVSDGFPVGTIRPGFRPYIELMAGVFTENQPDFSWLMPYEEKQFTQYFMPYHDIGIVKQANKDFVINVEEVKTEGTPSEKTDCKIRFKIMATSKQSVRIEFTGGWDDIYYDKVVTLNPTEVLEETVVINPEYLDDLILCISEPGDDGRVLLEYTGEFDEVRPTPPAAEAPLSPQDTKSIDQLYLTGLHLEQYRHATWSALDYYEEALRRDPNDYRINTQMGLWYLRRCRFKKAEKYLQTAVRVLQQRNPNPYDGESLFYLGVTHKFMGLRGRAVDNFWKATWNKAWADAAFFELARISMADKNWEEALEELEHALILNSHNHQARALKAAALRKLRRKEEALAWIEESLRLDPFNYVCMVEQHLLTGSDKPLRHMAELMHGNVYNYHETALEYANAEMTEETKLVLKLAIKNKVEESPLTYYYLAFYGSLVNEVGKYIKKASQVKTDYCFPNRLEDASMFLGQGSIFIERDSKISYFLGCLYYDKRQYDIATEMWELSAELQPDFPTVWRNLALAYFNHPAVESNKDTESDFSFPFPLFFSKYHAEQKETSWKQKAVECMERAFHLDETDARVLMELDQLYKRLQRPHAERLAFLEKHLELVVQRDDLVLEMITLQNQTGRYEEAYQDLDNHIFHPWEGGEGKVPAQYQICRVEMAKDAISSLDKQGLGQAIRLLEECLHYPPHLGEGKLYGTQENDFYYLLGLAHEQQGDKDEARRCYEQATIGPTEPAAAMYYNDAKPDKIFYAALAYRKLGEDDKANGLCYKLINYGKQHLFEHQTMDYFAVSLPDLLVWDGDLDSRNVIHCNLMMALGHLGLAESDIPDAAYHRERGLHFLEEVERLDINHPVPPALRTLLPLLSI